MGKKKLPIFKSIAEEAKFWEDHSIVDYLSDLDEVDNLFILSPSLSKKIKERAKKKPISIRLAKWEIELAKRIARRKHTSYQLLLRGWIDEGIRHNLSLQHN